MTRYRFLQTPVFESLVEELMDDISDAKADSQRASGRPDGGPLWALNSLPASTRLEASRSSAYSPDAFAPEQDITKVELPTDAESIFRELGLKPGLTADQIATIRRGFAQRHHPDRFPMELQKNATERMMIANALCDSYPLRKT